MGGFLFACHWRCRQPHGHPQPGACHCTQHSDSQLKRPSQGRLVCFDSSGGGVAGITRRVLPGKFVLVVLGGDPYRYSYQRRSLMIWRRFCKTPTWAMWIFRPKSFWKEWSRQSSTSIPAVVALEQQQEPRPNPACIQPALPPTTQRASSSLMALWLMAASILPHLSTHSNNISLIPTITLILTSCHSN